MTLSEIKEAVKHLRKGQSLDLPTELNARKLTPRLHYIQDDDGNNEVFRCQTIPGGVRVICEGSYKITAVYSTDVRHSD